MGFARYVEKLGGNAEEIDVSFGIINACGPCNDYLTRFGRIEVKPGDSYTLEKYYSEKRCDEDKDIVIELKSQKVKRNGKEKDHLIITPLDTKLPIRSEEPERRFMCKCSKIRIILGMFPHRCYLVEDMIKSMEKELKKEGMKEGKKVGCSYLFQNPEINV